MDSSNLDRNEHPELLFTHFLDSKLRPKSGDEPAQNECTVLQLTPATQVRGLIWFTDDVMLDFIFRVEE
jgi:hypothetical protein